MRSPVSLRLLYPLRPLTEAGRVLLCVAASLFAALVLVVWAAAPVEAGEPASAFGHGLTTASAAR